MRNQIEHCKVKQNSDERLWSEGVREEWRHVERERERERFRLFIPAKAVVIIQSLHHYIHINQYNDIKHVKIK